MTELKKLFKYSVVGTTGTIIDLLGLFILVEFFEFEVLLSATISFILAATNNFIWNKKWTFYNKNKNYHHQYVKFLLVSVIGLIFTLILMYTLHKVIGIWYMYAKIMTSIVVLYWNYFGNKVWTFKPTIAKIQPTKYLYEYSIVIPAYNEKDRIISTIKSICDYLQSYKKSAEIIIVDDGSIDDTTKIVKEFSEKEKLHINVIKLEQNMGKGYAVKIGVINSVGKYILFMDADNSTKIEELEKFEQYKNSHSIIIGSRKIAGSNISNKQPFYRRFISKIGSNLSSVLIKDVKDTQCGFKLFKNEIAKFIFEKQKINRFGFDLEILAIAQHYEFDILELPVNWSDDRKSKLRPFKDTFLTLKEFILIQYNLLLEKY